jgi:hypothetical protein
MGPRDWDLALVYLVSQIRFCWLQDWDADQNYNEPSSHELIEV